MRDWVRVALVMFGIGWGANQFAPMLLVYRQQQHQSEAAVAAMLAAYAVGLIPALVIAGGYSDRHGRKAALIPAAVVSIAASLILIAGMIHPGFLYAGRLLAGVATGGAMAAGSPWIRQLSTDAGPGTGARRAAVALSGGFGGGPIIAGLVAQWLPEPELLPYVIHIVLMLTVTPGLWRLPEVTMDTPRPHKVRLFTKAASQPQFLIGVVPWAPWVFGAATLSFATMPSLVAGSTAGMPIAFSGLTAGVTLLTGVGVQPAAQRLNQRSRTLTTISGLALAAAGLAAGSAVALKSFPLRGPATLLVALILGSAYGVLLVSGLVEVEHLAQPSQHGALVAVYYALTYLGFTTPFIFTQLTRLHSPTFWLLVAAAGAMLTIPLKAIVGHQSASPPELRQRQVP